MNPLCQSSARDLARRIAQREVSSVDVVQAHLGRIREANPAINAVVRVLEEDALAAARAADAAVAAGAPLGPLHGVPFTAKENIDVAGLPTTCGVAALARAVPPMDAPVVERMKAAGAVLIGRTNLPDMGLRMATESTLHGTTRNPWNGGLTAGGSSGGEAAAIACGLSPVGLGNDLGGSLRNPANACGIASIKPSAGRVPHAQLVPGPDAPLAMQWMLVQGPMARDIGDVRLALQVLAGAHPRDPASISAPLQHPPAGRVRVAVMEAPPGSECDPRVCAMVRKAADALADAGYDVVCAAPPRYEDALQAWSRLMATDMAAIGDKMAMLGERVRDLVTTIAQHVQPCTTAAKLTLLAMRREGIARAWSQFMALHPLVLGPTWTQLPFAHGWDMEPGNEVLHVASPVLPANLLGLPSACVPAGIDPDSGMPVGVLLTGRRMDDGTCLDAAEHVQARSGVATPIDPR